MLFEVASQLWSKWIEAREGTIAFPTWSSDSRSLYYENNNDYLRVALGSDRFQVVASFKGIRLPVGRWGSWATVAPDGCPLTVRDISTHEIYALDIKWP